MDTITVVTLPDSDMESSMGVFLNQNYILDACCDDCAESAISLIARACQILGKETVVERTRVTSANLEQIGLCPPYSWGDVERCLTVLDENKGYI